MTQQIKMYNYLRVYLSPVMAYDLVKEKYPKMSIGMIDLEVKRLKFRY